MVFDRLRPEVQLRGDLGIGIAQGQQVEDLGLALGQSIGIAPGRCARSLRDTGAFTAKTLPKGRRCRTGAEIVEDLQGVQRGVMIAVRQ